MSDEVCEIVRVLQLTTYDEDEWESDAAAVMRRYKVLLHTLMRNSIPIYE
jgi:vinculin